MLLTASLIGHRACTSIPLHTTRKGLSPIIAGFLLIRANHFLGDPIMALKTLFAPSCAGCDGRCLDAGGFCPLCRPTVYRLSTGHCPRCALPQLDVEAKAPAPIECSSCRRDPPAFSRTHALFEYAGAVAEAIRRIKYSTDFPALRALCRTLSPWLMDRLSETPSPLQIIPIPAHPSSLRRRGFHLPSLLLRWSLPRRHRHLITNGLWKPQKTRKQASLPLGQRHSNIRNAFRCTPRLVPDTKAVLFDDVLTSGATVHSAAQTLKQAGLEDIEVWTVARAPAPHGMSMRPHSPATSDGDDRNQSP